MILKDSISNLRGEFTIQVFKKDGSIETYEDKNLIMDTARTNMAELIGGYSQGMRITRLAMGNKGHVGEDILNYKKVGEDDIFITERTSLFSEDPLYAVSNNKDSFTYYVDFDSTGDLPLQTDDVARGQVAGAGETQLCSVDRLVNDRTTTFTITIPDYAGNRPGEGAVVAYTEAALYAGVDIFSMKTFPARVKEDTVKFVITWSIIF